MKNFLSKKMVCMTIEQIRFCIIFVFCDGRFPLDCSFHSFIPDISIVPLQVYYYSEALLTTARILCQSFTPKRHRQLRMKDLPKVPMWRPEWYSKPMSLQTKGNESTNEPARPINLSLTVRVELNQVKKSV